MRRSPRSSSDPDVESTRSSTRTARGRHARARLPRAGECELAFLGLVPELAGQGHGRWLFAEALRLAWREGVDRVHVHTCTLDHPAALAAYRRAGFTAFKRAFESFPTRACRPPAARLRASGAADRQADSTTAACSRRQLNVDAAPSITISTTVNAALQRRGQDDDQAPTLSGSVPPSQPEDDRRAPRRPRAITSADDQEQRERSRTAASHGRWSARQLR